MTATTIPMDDSVDAGVRLRRSGTVATDTTPAAVSPAAVRRRGQLPTFAPMLDEVELAGWSSDRNQLSGNFHDWITLSGGRVMVAVGRVLDAATTDPTEAAMLGQLVSTALRAHAMHISDAGILLSLVGRSVYSGSTGEPVAALAVGVVDPTGGRVDLAVAGPCLAMRIRASECEVATASRPPLGMRADAAYVGHDIQLRPRERLALIAGPQTDDLPVPIRAEFASISAEAHRKMTAGEALGHVRRGCERTHRSDRLTSTSLAVIRRR